MRTRGLIVASPARLPLILLVVLSVSHPTFLVAQAEKAILIPDRVSCQSCKIVIAPTHQTISPPDGFSALPYTVTWDKRGRLYVPQSDARELPWVFDSAGNPIGRLGSEGEGPGQFRRARQVIPYGDSLLVLDPTLARISVFGPSLSFVRTFPAMTSMLSGLWLPSVQQLLLNASVQSKEDIGRPFFFVNHRGQVVGKAGSKLTVLPGPSNNSTAVRTVMVAYGPDKILAGFVHRYELEIWSQRRTLLTKYVRESSLFPPQQQSTKRVSVAQPQQPRPSLTSLWRDPVGNIWTLSSVADKDWQSATTMVGGRQDRDPTGYWDTMIEVLDLQSHTVVARTVIPDLCVAVSPRSELLCARRDENGSYLLALRKMALK